MTDTRYDIYTYSNGLRLDLWTKQLWDKLIARYPGLILTQGVKSGAAASGGTHLGLGVLDLYLGKWASKWRDVLKYAFELGFFGWFRPAIEGVWKTHIHLGVRGHSKMAQSLKNQQASWTRLRNGLKGDGADFFTWRPANFKKTAAYVTKAIAPKFNTKAAPLVNVSFSNIWGNSVEGGRNIAKRYGKIVRAAVAGSPAVVAFAEVRPSQKSELSRRMAKARYELISYSSENMLAVYARSNVTSVAASFSKFTQQDGGNVEGVLRVRFRVDGSWFQVGVLHLDHDSSEVKKRSNLKQAVAALERFGKERLQPDWKSRTLIIGDMNDTDVAKKVLETLGFKSIVISGLDQAFVGSKRVVRGASVTPKAKAGSDHPRILVRIGRS
jgi:hypothetical protein